LDSKPRYKSEIHIEEHYWRDHTTGAACHPISLSQHAIPSIAATRHPIPLATIRHPAPIDITRYHVPLTQTCHPVSKQKRKYILECMIGVCVITCIMLFPLRRRHRSIGATRHPISLPQHAIPSLAATRHPIPLATTRHPAPLT
jgi:hypothetical protein